MKCGELIININELQIEYQKTSKQLIGNDDLAREREERIEKFRNESYDLKILWENLDNQHKTLEINYIKVSE